MTMKAMRETLQMMSESGYARLLTGAGFRSFQGDKLNWACIHGEVIWRFHLLCYSAGGFGQLTLFYGVHPLYFQAPLNPPIPYNNELGSILVAQDYPKGRCVFYPYNGIYAQEAPDYGNDFFRFCCLPWFQERTTAELVFQKRWERYCSGGAETEAALPYLLKPDLVDELIWFEDREHYVHAIHATEMTIKKQQLREQLISSSAISNSEKRKIRAENKYYPSLEALNLQLSVLCDGGEAEYKKQLASRAESQKKSLCSILL